MVAYISLRKKYHSMNTKIKHELDEYISNLWDKDIGKDARDFLKFRNIKPSTARAWNIGYCPSDYIPKCYSTNEYPMYTKMQGRVILPVYNSIGELLTLSGRAINDNLKPKYIHYSFPTSKTLFGLYINEKDIIKKNLIFFAEGQIDVISAWQNGLRTCVCTFGSHFSSDQILLASRYTNRVFILYDDDEAGSSGASASMKKLKIKGDVNVKILSGIFRNGEDLDNFVNKYDVSYFDKYINGMSEEEILKYKLSLQN